ncbi:5-oxoprolinase/urea amidolyase family protein [Hydrogenophaga sp. PBL-H3]|uniref:5-oxoprolinase/urea amidolyase family protein n=1 Tax=Hydrogenophaga sp. PBL-H3 TaxID=434010 RepID=UPI00131FB64D|nr:5-oxoprolinase/urea amidolyase family protein [Hydrogenophaga sp. PBL-H3]QHE77257.1 5-oxoprolinase/urea amidolyase family protein [Hydrogenophaga sp. PBL-H3]QHE81681.1 5-oxoprolinase/urea amidolyase family protein [Hydrogenophaga sp. PBL-H3]
MFSKVLIANRGAIACRIIRTLKTLGVQSVAVYSEADAQARHVREADEAYLLGPAPAAESYLRADRILQIAKDCDAQAIHPGYGFLSENPAFAEACEAAGIAFIGPAPEQMRAFGLKHTARDLAEQRGVPLLPGSGLLTDLAQAQSEASRVGFPVMLKSTAGGGGIGMRLVWNAAELTDAFDSVGRMAQANFKDAGLFIEKYVEQARHIEVQVFGDGVGGVIALGERDCSVQRRNQKVIEETPAPGLSDAQRSELHATAVRLAQAVNYRSAGTVEFVYDASTGEFYFLEVNTRLQVEHGVTEQVCGVDLVAWMLQLAAGDLPTLHTLQPTPQGASIQVRLYAEDPAKNFQPSAGLLTEVVFPADARLDSWVERGTEVPAWYDPMLAKLIVTADTREAALKKMEDALDATRLAGIETNLGYLRQVVRDPVFRTGKQVTRFLSTFAYRPATIDVIEPGVQTSVQDWPGRQGYWDVGVPPSGPMDMHAHRAANALVGNTSDAAALEITLAGPTLRFNTATVVAVTGAPAKLTLNGEAVPMWQAIQVPAGGLLAVGRCEHGVRLALAVAGGLDVPLYLGSRSTFTLGQFGGHAGRHLRTGDVLHLADPVRAELPSVRAEPVEAQRAQTLRQAQGERLEVPEYTHHWDIKVLYGPHGAPDFFTPDDITMFFGTDWKIHHNSSRTGVRLIGPKPQWARTDGGEAGLHPSNIHDNAYAIGAIDFTGDMPVILGPDGPSLGGFVCPAVVLHDELWKLGQLRPGDTVRFHRQAGSPASPVLDDRAAQGDRPRRVIRQAGDRYVLIEFGPLTLDLELRMRVQALLHGLKARELKGVIDLTPGIRSLQVHFDPTLLPRDALLQIISEADDALPPVDEMVVPSRTVVLPLSWDDPQTKLAIEKYMQSVRPDAPWCPSNIEFIRRINGLDSIEDVFNIVFDARYLVLGLGDVYLGAPVATPLDPRHRLVTTKYNPARTWTPENAVGIGGAYLCVYGMEGPGGYQFVGRTLQMWNRWRHGAPGTPFEQPWLLRFFDQIRFEPVSEDALKTIRANFPHGGHALRTEDGTFSLKDYRRFLNENAESITSFKARQQAAFEAERDRWVAAGQNDFSSDDAAASAGVADEVDLPEGGRLLATSVPGNVWKVSVSVGQQVQAGDVLLVIESMKMEFNLLAPANATVHSLMCAQGGAVSAGQNVLVLIDEAV